MSNYACLERYIPLVEFMGKICGKSYEIILHDVSTPERSPNPRSTATCGVSAAKQHDLPPRRFTRGRDALTSRCVKRPARNI